MSASPHSPEAEKQLLACCFIDGPETVSRCLEAGLAEADFFDPRHQTIYAKIIDLFTRGLPIDVSVLYEEMTAAKQMTESVGGLEKLTLAYLTEVTGTVGTAAGTGYFIERVRSLARMRAVIRTTTSIAERAPDNLNDVDQFIDQAEKEFFAVAHRTTGNTLRPARESIKRAMTVIDQMLTRKGELTGISSGFADLDALTWGFQRSDMIVLAARPSMGKTALALNFADAACLSEKTKPAPTLIFSLEMSHSQLAMRMLCSRARVNLKLLRDGLLSKNGNESERLLSASQEISNAPLLIDDTAGLTITQLRAKARRAHTRQPLGLIIVDYLQLLNPTESRAPREQQVSEASRGLKALAKELNVPVIVLSQLNRASEKENRAPKLADLRESGAIEQDADVVLMLARPRDADDKFQVAADTAELIVAKQRNGPVGDLKLTFLRDITRFENYHA